MTPNCEQCTNSVECILLKQGENYSRLRFNPTVAAPLQEAPARKNTHLRHQVRESVGNQRHGRFVGRRR